MVRCDIGVGRYWQRGTLYLLASEVYFDHCSDQKSRFSPPHPPTHLTTGPRQNSGWLHRNFPAFALRDRYWRLSYLIHIAQNILYECASAHDCNRSTVKHQYENNVQCKSLIIALLLLVIIKAENRAKSPMCNVQDVFCREMWAVNQIRNLMKWR